MTTQIYYCLYSARLHSDCHLIRLHRVSLACLGFQTQWTGGRCRSGLGRSSTYAIFPTLVAVQPLQISRCRKSTWWMTALTGWSLQPPLALCSSTRCWVVNQSTTWAWAGRMKMGCWWMGCWCHSRRNRSLCPHFASVHFRFSPPCFWSNCVSLTCFGTLNTLDWPCMLWQR